MRGFSFLELIVVVGIIGVVSFFSFIEAQEFTEKTKLSSTSREIDSVLRLARSLSLTQRKIYRVIFLPQKGEYFLEDETGRVELKRKILPGVIFANPSLGKKGEEDGVVEFGREDGAFVFYPKGTAEGGSIYLKLQERERWCTITLSPTGYIRIYFKKH